MKVMNYRFLPLPALPRHFINTEFSPRLRHDTLNAAHDFLHDITLGCNPNENALRGGILPQVPRERYTTAAASFPHRLCGDCTCIPKALHLIDIEDSL